MEQIIIAGRIITVHRFNAVILGAGAAGMNCAKKLVEYRTQKGVPDPRSRIAVVTAGLPLGASRMSGSDKQTYYKLGTNPFVPDSAESFAHSLTAAGCCHADLALAEGIGSLRAFYNLVEAGVPFPTDAMGACIGYKTDHDPYERAASAGPGTSRMMAECLETIVRRYGVPVFDHHEAVELIADGDGKHRRIVGLMTLDKKCDKPFESLCLFLADNFVLAAGGPGALYETSVYPLGQTGIHGLALRAGLPAENLTESQFGLAAVPFRWNVSGSYMQAVPRLFSTDPDGRGERDFLADVFPTMSKMAAAIFLKGYQWPFDAQRVTGHQSSLIDLFVTQETQNGRRVFLDFRRNPVAAGVPFALADLEPQARDYLAAAGATQPLPIDRLACMNPPAIDIFKEHGIDLRTRPLEVAVCAQHNNGGFAVDRWWQSPIPRTFVIGEMAATHGVKRPGGSALNAGQVGAQRAAEYIANVYPDTLPGVDVETGPLRPKLESLIARLGRLRNPAAPRTAAQALADIRRRMTAAAGHLRGRHTAQAALAEAMELVRDIAARGLRPAATDPNDWTDAIRAEHLALAAVAWLKAIVELGNAGAGSRGSYLVLADDGAEIHPRLNDPAAGKVLRFKPENQSLRTVIQRLTFDPAAPDLFRTEMLPPRQAPTQHKAFELAWADYRTAAIYRAP